MGLGRADGWTDDVLVAAAVMGERERERSTRLRDLLRDRSTFSLIVLKKLRSVGDVGSAGCVCRRGK